MSREAYADGVSTCSVDELLKAMEMRGISKSLASRLCTEIDERVHALLDRPVEGDWPLRKLRYPALIFAVLWHSYVLSELIRT